MNMNNLTGPLIGPSPPRTQSWHRVKGDLHYPSAASMGQPSFWPLPAQLFQNRANNRKRKILRLQLRNKRCILLPFGNRANAFHGAHGLHVGLEQRSLSEWHYVDLTSCMKENQKMPLSDKDRIQGHVSKAVTRIQADTTIEILPRGDSCGR